MIRNPNEVLNDLETYAGFDVGRNPGLITADRLALVERLREMAVEIAEASTSTTDATRLQDVLYIAPGLLRVCKQLESEIHAAASQEPKR